MERFDFIDYDEGLDPREPFFENAFPCESCGEPCDERKPAEWDEELMVGPCCYRNLEVETPEVPTCEALQELMMCCESVDELVIVSKVHRRTCAACGGMKLEPRKESRIKQERAA